jgi:hypothetical protein
MTRINALRNIVGTRDSVAWGKDAQNVATATWGHINALVFAAVLIVCSVAVGCSSEKPKPVSSNNQIPVTQPETTMAPMPSSTMQADKPAPKKVVHKKPATVNYTDKTSGVTFEYPRRYAIETGNAATDLLMSSPIPMNFVQPGGVALAAVELPETSFANTDFSSAFFNVSVHKTLTADQCTEFAVPLPKIVEAKIVEPKIVAASETKPETKTEIKDQTKSNSQPAQTARSTEAWSQPASTPAAPATSAEAQPVAVQASAPAAQSQPEPQGSKLMLGDLELRAAEAVSGEGTRQSDAKYFHVFQNGACYEFALNVTTVASQDGLIKHVDRDKVFDRLQKILATVKINPVTPEVTAETPATLSAPVNPAQ